MSIKVSFTDSLKAGEFQQGLRDYQFEVAVLDVNGWDWSGGRTKSAITTVYDDPDDEQRAGLIRLAEACGGEVEIIAPKDEA